MKPSRRQFTQGTLSALLVAASWGGVAAAVAQTKSRSAFTEIIWEDLMPEKWLGEVKTQMAEIGRLGFLVDGSEAANKAMQDLREKWDKAPIEEKWIDQPVKIAGYVVTLDANKKSISEFLLVPYFGACIHLPPPPANQIILVKLDKPVSKLVSMDTVWVEGSLRDARVDTGIAVTGYLLETKRVYPYVEKKK
jgi:hypothetical protein